MEYLGNHGIPCEADTPLHWPGTFIPGDTRRNTLLSVKECLHNIVKHAKASHAIICLAVHNGTTRLTVQDNGVGFMLAATTPSPNNTGMGLQTMYERAVALGGQLRVITAPGEGTRVEAILPMN